MVTRRSLRAFAPTGAPMLRTLKPLVPLALAAAVLLSAGPVRAADPVGFVAGVEDLPLMPGLTPLPDQLVRFDKPQGRVVEAAARGRVDAAQVRGFYRDSLPQLGWRPAGELAYTREGEVLRLEILPETGAGARGTLTVRFILSPE